MAKKDSFYELFPDIREHMKGSAEVSGIPLTPQTEFFHLAQAMWAYPLHAWMSTMKHAGVLQANFMMQASGTQEIIERHQRGQETPSVEAPLIAAK